MEPVTVGLVGLLALFVMLVLRVPVGLSLLAVGFFGVAYLNSFQAALATLVTETYGIASYYTLSVIPLFVLMGNLASASGLSRDLYAAANALIGHWRGGLASATIIGCGGFAAVSGSSLASAVTMGRVALPEMEKFGYDQRLATGSITAGGTLGILIPPSTGFIIYAILSEQSIGRLFMAGILPGLLLISLFVLTVSILVILKPSLAPAREKAGTRERAKAVLNALPIILVSVLTVGGIYVGAFTPVEAAGIGAFLVLGISLMRRCLTFRSLYGVLLITMRTSAMFYLILIAAHVFSPFVALSQLPQVLGDYLLGFELGMIGTLLVILAAYIVLGTFLEGFAMLVLTLPIVLPIVEAMGIDLIWFGVLLVIVLEMGLITPPVGLNVFAIKGIAEHIPLGKMFRGVMPFWVAMLVCLILLILFPQISLLLPDTMFGN